MRFVIIVIAVHVANSACVAISVIAGHVAKGACVVISVISIIVAVHVAYACSTWTDFQEQGSHNCDTRGQRIQC